MKKQFYEMPVMTGFEAVSKVAICLF